MSTKSDARVPNWRFSTSLHRRFHLEGRDELELSSEALALLEKKRRQHKTKILVQEKVVKYSGKYEIAERAHLSPHNHRSVERHEQQPGPEAIQRLHTLLLGASRSNHVNDTVEDSSNSSASGGKKWKQAAVAAAAKSLLITELRRVGDNYWVAVNPDASLVPDLLLDDHDRIWVQSNSATGVQGMRCLVQKKSDSSTWVSKERLSGLVGVFLEKAGLGKGEFAFILDTESKERGWLGKSLASMQWTLSKGCKADSQNNSQRSILSEQASLKPKPTASTSSSSTAANSSTHGIAAINPRRRLSVAYQDLQDLQEVSLAADPSSSSHLSSGLRSISDLHSSTLFNTDQDLVTSTGPDGEHLAILNNTLDSIDLWMLPRISPPPRSSSEGLLVRSSGFAASTFAHEGSSNPQALAPTATSMTNTGLKDLSMSSSIHSSMHLASPAAGHQDSAAFISKAAPSPHQDSHSADPESNLWTTPGASLPTLQTVSSDLVHYIGNIQDASGSSQDFTTPTQPPSSSRYLPRRSRIFSNALWRDFLPTKGDRRASSMMGNLQPSFENILSLKNEAMSFSSTVYDTLVEDTSNMAVSERISAYGQLEGFGTQPTLSSSPASLLLSNPALSGEKVPEEPSMDAETRRRRSKNARLAILGCPIAGDMLGSSHPGLSQRGSKSHLVSVAPGGSSAIKGSGRPGALSGPAVYSLNLNL